MTENTKPSKSDPSQPEVRIRLLDGDLGCLASMWESLYVHQREHGLIAAVPENAFQEWERSQFSVNGRFGFAAIASRDDMDIGFCAGRMRPLPAYYGGGYVGYISEVYVNRSARGAGIGKLLVDFGVAWFQERGIHRVELQVVWRNEQALRFYRKNGWVEDLVQLVKMV